jgi:hypothetical protein
MCHWKLLPNNMTESTGLCDSDVYDAVICCAGVQLFLSEVGLDWSLQWMVDLAICKIGTNDGTPAG